MIKMAKKEPLTLIGIEKDLHAKLLNIAFERQQKIGKRQYFSDVIRYLVEKYDKKAKKTKGVENNG
jgi:hypothetical protein